MNTKDQLKEKVARFFSLYPNRDILFATEDGNVFLVRSDASNHARALGKPYYEFKKVEDDHNEVNPEQEKEIMVAKLRARAAEIDPEKDDYREMLKILKGLDLAPENNTKVATIAAFKEYKKNLSPNSPE